MSDEERALLEELRRLYDEYQQLNRQITAATHRQRFSRQPGDIRTAEMEEQSLLVEIGRLMDRLAAVEGDLMRVRNRARPGLH